MPHLDEADFVLTGAQRLDDAVDAVARQAENDLDAEIDQRFSQHVGGGDFAHRLLPELCG